MNWRKIIEDLQRAGIRQIDIAARCGVSQSSVSDLKKGRTLEPSYGFGATLLQMHSDAASRSKRRPTRRQAPARQLLAA